MTCTPATGPGHRYAWCGSLHAGAHLPKVTNSGMFCCTNERAWEVASTNPSPRGNASPRAVCAAQYTQLYFRVRYDSLNLEESDGFYLWWWLWPRRQMILEDFAQRWVFAESRPAPLAMLFGWLSQQQQEQQQRGHQLYAGVLEEHTGAIDPAVMM